MNEFNIANKYSIEELEAIQRKFKLAADAGLSHFPCMEIDCNKCPFNTIKGECGGKSSIIIAKYGEHPDWRQIESRWGQDVIDSAADIEESKEMDDGTPGRIVISLVEPDAKVLSEYIRRANETLVVPDAMWRVSEYVKRLIDASLTNVNKDGD